MAHELTKTYKCHVRIVFTNDKFQRSDRPCEIRELKNHCTHDISIVNTRIWSLILRTVDKLNSNTQVEKLNISRIVGLVSMNSSYGIPVFKKRPPRFIRGFFQSYSLVEGNSSTIYHEISKCFENVPNFVRTNESYNVSHIRRGDYTLQPKSLGLLTFKYYKKHTISTGPLYICTDDDAIVHTVKESFPESIVLTPQESSTWETFKLMAHANHLIMANSSLSWWAGWFLLKSPGSKVIFPSPWTLCDPRITENLLIEKAEIAESSFEES